MLLGVLKKPPFIGVAAQLDFNAFPFVDLTGRHTVTSGTGVSQVSNKAKFSGATTAFITLTGNQSDFTLQNNFTVTCRLTQDAATYAFAEIWRIYNPSATYTTTSGEQAQTYLDGLGQIVVKLQTLDIVNSGFYVTTGVEYLIEVSRVGNTITLKVDGVSQGSYTSATLNTKLVNVQRQLNIGGSTSGQMQNGKVDDFKFETL